jgi:hypothetical protein
VCIDGNFALKHVKSSIAPIVDAPLPKQFSLNPNAAKLGEMIKNRSLVIETPKTVC